MKLTVIDGEFIPYWFYLMGLEEKSGMPMQNVSRNFIHGS